MTVPEAPTVDPLFIRRRRAVYRAQHRGTKEMDALVGRYTAARVDTLGEDDLTLLEQFLAVADPTLQNWLFAKEAVTDTAFAGLVADIRAFHGLDAVKGV